MYKLAFCDYIWGLPALKLNFMEFVSISYQVGCTPSITNMAKGITTRFHQEISIWCIEIALGYITIQTQNELQIVVM